MFGKLAIEAEILNLFMEKLESATNHYNIKWNKFLKLLTTKISEISVMEEVSLGRESEERPQAIGELWTMKEFVSPFTQ